MLDKLTFLTKLTFLVLFLLTHSLFAQEETLHGIVKVDGEPTEFATIILENTEIGSTSETNGQFYLSKIPAGTYTVVASYVGYKKVSQTITIDDTHNGQTLNFNLTESSFTFNDVVVTGTKTFKRKTDSPVIVNVISSQTLDDVQACNLSEGLKFQPGLRVENNCQTCSYTQLRMNGLAGGYSQILINGRPVFSPLTGLYGLEQLPVNMIERIEVVRGGGSSLYGSSAVGGTVNVITKVPTENTYELNYTYQNINGQSNDNVLSGNATLVSDAKDSGISFFLNNRKRDLYDHNGDNFSELPLLENTSLGASAFFLPNKNQKIEFSISKLNEFRYGGEMVDKPAYLTQQSEERTHNVWMGNLDYQINFNNDNSTLITYAAWQNTDRRHYTGIFPDEPEAIQNHLENSPYGTSNTTTLNGGLQLNHRLKNFLSGKNVLTLGSEYIYDDVYDEIPSYRYLIDQTTTDFGTFLQSDWEIVRDLTLLSGVRMDVHNLINKPIFSPRASLLYKFKTSTQFRLNYGTGFRAPQAFDTDLHIAFAGGGVSRVQLSPDLLPETSESFSASVNYDKVTEHYIVGFTLEGFRTRLNQAFYLQPIGEDEFGEVFEKQNGQGATVQGVTLELRANFDQKVQIETGFTLQSNEFDTAVEYIDGVEGITEFIRTPRDYGFATISFMPNKRFNANINYLYTGNMKVPHFAGAPNQEVDEIITSDSFSEVSLKVAYNFSIKKAQTNIEFYGGVKNIFNSYQENFDIGKNRDSNFVYGPGLPRTFFVGVKFSGEES
jgi:outer membrane receptor for ferrienterochelin and colicins